MGQKYISPRGKQPTQPNDRAQVPPAAGGTKKPYSPPLLSCYGTLFDRVRGAFFGEQMDGSAGGSKPGVG